VGTPHSAALMPSTASMPTHRAGEHAPGLHRPWLRADGQTSVLPRSADVTCPQCPPRPSPVTLAPPQSDTALAWAWRQGRQSAPRPRLPYCTIYTAPLLLGTSVPSATVVHSVLEQHLWQIGQLADFRKPEEHVYILGWLELLP